MQVGVIRVRVEKIGSSQREGSVDGRVVFGVKNGVGCEGVYGQ